MNVRADGRKIMSLQIEIVSCSVDVCFVEGLQMRRLWVERNRGADLKGMFERKRFRSEDF